MMKSHHVLFLPLLGLTVAYDLDVGSDNALYDIDPPYVAAQLVSANKPLSFVEGEDTPEELWRQALPFEVNLRQTGAHVDSKGVRHAFAMQMVGEMPVWNAVGNLNIRPDGTVVESYQRFLKDVSPPRSAWTHTTLNDALRSVQKTVSNMNLTADNGQLVYVRDNAGDLRKAWHFYAMEGEPLRRPNLNLDDAVDGAHLLQGGNIDIPIPNYEHYWDALVDAETLDMIGLNDLVHHAAQYSYNVFSMPDKDPSSGTQQFKMEQMEQPYSPIGWQNLGPLYSYYVSPYTFGNNVFGMTSDFQNYGFATNHAFNFAFDASKEPEDQLSVCLTQLYYTNNRLHDIFYQAGFDEASGNFQLNNLGRGGIENDPVYALCHANGKNNAQFMTLPDGTPGVMSMYLWDIRTPKRDSAMDSSVVTHEYMHGVSNRLTGGPSHMCLTSTQSGGLGEGWGDFMGIALHARANDNRNSRFAVGAYLIGNTNGVRQYPYSSNMALNPIDWSHYIMYQNSVHKLGTIWGIMLFECFWNLVDEFGFDPDLIHGNGGNNLMIQLVVDGMKYQPCEPTFIQARDAIFASLFDRTSDSRVSKASEALWAAFSKRGLGPNAGDGGQTDHMMPDDPSQFLTGPSSHRARARLADKAPPRIVDAILITLGVIAIILIICSLALVFRNWRLRRALRDKHGLSPSDRTPLRSAVESPYQV